MSSIIVSSTQASVISISAPQVNTISITAPTQRVISGTINLGSAGVPGQGVAAGGTTGQSLVKASGANYDTTWADRLASVQEDTSPHLGGNLDVQTYSITTDSANQNINIVANGTGYINLDGAVKIKNQATPAVIEGGLYADTSGNIYFGDDTAWKKVLLEDGSVGSDLITITAQDGDVATQEKIRISDGTNSDDVVIEAGTNMSISRSGDTITLNNTLANTTLTQEEVEDYAGNLIDSSNTGEQTGITVTYQDATNDVDFVVDDQTIEASDSNGDQSVVRLTMSNPTADDTVDITAGSNISFGSITANGFTISSDGTASDVALTDESSDTTCFPVFATDATGDQTLHTDASGLTYDSSTETLEVKNLKVNDASNPYTLPSADGEDGQVLTTDGAGVVSFAYPKTISESVKNVSGGPLPKGTPVHVTGSVGNLAEVIAADAATNYPAHFVLDEDLADDGEGQGIALGFINNVDVPDASIYTEGQTVYLGASGGWVTTKPTGTNAIQNLGIIIKVNTSTDKISGIVMGAGRANDVPNIPNGQAWIGNASGVATPTTLATVATTGEYSDLIGTPAGGLENVVEDTTPQLGGDLDVNGNAITGSTVSILGSTGELMITATENGPVALRYDNNLKLSTKSDGVNITGELEADSLDIDGNAEISGTLNTHTIPGGTGTIALTSDITDTNTNISTGDLTATGSHVYDIAGETQEIDVNGGEFKIDDLSHEYLRATGSELNLQGLQFPSSDGTTGQAITTNGAGVLSFSTFTDTNTNLGNSDQTLATDRTIDLDGNTLTFDGAVSDAAKITNNGEAEFRRRITAKGYTSGPGSVLFNNSDNTYGVSVQAPGSLSATYSLTLPTTNGDADQVLTTNGFGVLSWSDAGADTNLGSDDQTLSADRTVEMGGNNLIFDNSSTEVARITPQGYVQATGRSIVNGNGSVGGQVIIKDADSSNSVTLTVPSTVSSNLTLALPSSDGSSGQVIQTDGSGNLSFVDNGFPKSLTTLTGRFQFDADDDNRTIICGNSTFGTNYYLWSTEIFDTVSSGTVDTTTQNMSNIYAGPSFRMPELAKVRWDFQHKPGGSTAYSLDFRAQIWSIGTFPSTGSQSTWTLRADRTFTSGSSTSLWDTNVATTTSAIPEGHYVIFVVGLDNQTISSTVYLSQQGTVSLVL